MVDGYSMIFENRKYAITRPQIVHLHQILHNIEMGANWGNFLTNIAKILKSKMVDSDSDANS